MGFKDNVRAQVNGIVDQQRLSQTAYKTTQIYNAQQGTEGIVTAVAGTKITVEINGKAKTGYASNRQVRVGDRVSLFGSRVW